MADIIHNSNDIKDTDIIFECPFCAKSLAIDYRGAGLFIPCVDCGKTVTVPIPEGMELADIDLSEEEQEIQILNLRKSLLLAEHRIQQLELEILKITTSSNLLKDQSGADSELRNVMLSQSALLENVLYEIKRVLNVDAKPVID